MGRAELDYNYSNNGRGGRGVSKCCSYKRTTVIICSINIVVALYVFQNLYTSLYSYSYRDSHSGNCFNLFSLKSRFSVNVFNPSSEIYCLWLPLIFVSKPIILFFGLIRACVMEPSCRVCFCAFCWSLHNFKCRWNLVVKFSFVQLSDQSPMFRWR